MGSALPPSNACAIRRRRDRRSRSVYSAKLRVLCGTTALACAGAAAAQPIGYSGAQELNGAAAFAIVAVVLVAGLIAQSTKRRM